MSLRNRVEEMYGLKVRELRKISGVYLLRTDAGNLNLKAFRFPGETVRFIAVILQELARRGFERAQRIRSTVDHAGFVEYGGIYYTLTDWVDGNRPQFRKVHDFKKAVRTLAKFHRAAQGFPAHAAPPGRIRYGDIGHDLSHDQELVRQYEPAAFLVSQYDEALDLWAHPYAEAAVAAERDACAFVHGDYNYPNLIKDRRGKLHLIDFENTSLHARMKDLSHILHRNYPWNGRGMMKWIEYYDRHRALSSYDLHLLHALLSAPYPVVRNIRIGGLRHARPLIPSRRVLRQYRTELNALR